jgi:hypothetical protein
LRLFDEQFRVFGLSEQLPRLASAGIASYGPAHPADRVTAVQSASLGHDSKGQRVGPADSGR